MGAPQRWDMQAFTDFHVREKYEKEESCLQRLFWKEIQQPPVKVTLYNGTLKMFITDDLRAQPADATKQYLVVFIYNST